MRSYGRNEFGIILLIELVLVAGTPGPPEPPIVIEMANL